jgi:hypothetical protein
MDIRDPMTLDVDDLRAEVWFWRERAVDHLRRLLEAEATTPRDEVSAWLNAFNGAATGEELDKCAICDQALYPGQACLREVDSGDVHAGCLGSAIGPNPIKPGDFVQLDPECVVDENDEPDEDSDGVLKAHEFRPMRDAAEVAAITSRAMSLLGWPEPTREPA